MVTDLDRRGLASAVALSTTAGWVDATAFLAIGGYFVSFMSGNTTRGAVDAVSGGMWTTAVVLLGAFAFGVAAAAVAQRLVGTRPQSTALVLASLPLLGASLLAALDGAAPLAIGALLAASMGAVNVVLARDHTVSFGVTYMTGALVKAAQGAVGAAWGERRTGWARYLLLWVAIAVGALGGAVASALVGLAALWVALAVLLVLLALSLARRT